MPGIKKIWEAENQKPESNPDIMLLPGYDIKLADFRCARHLLRKYASYLKNTLGRMLQRNPPFYLESWKPERICKLRMMRAALMELVCLVAEWGAVV